MVKKTFRAEEIINELREAEVLSSWGKTVSEVCRALGISDQTYYRWRKAYGGMGTEQARRIWNRRSIKSRSISQFRAV